MEDPDIANGIMLIMNNVDDTTRNNILSFILAIQSTDTINQIRDYVTAIV